MQMFDEEIATLTKTDGTVAQEQWLTEGILQGEVMQDACDRLVAAHRKFEKLDGDPRKYYEPSTNLVALRALREEKKLSPGDTEKRTELLLCYILRVENGYTIPAVETLEKLARAMEIPTYQLFYDGTKAPGLPDLPKPRGGRETEWGGSDKDPKMLQQFCRVLARTTESDHKLLLFMAQKMTSANRAKTRMGLKLSPPHTICERLAA